MNDKRSKELAGLCVFCLVHFLSFLPNAFAQQKSGPDDPGQEASASQAQATLASLFGRGAKMPGIPRINGTIALPSFDSSGMKIDEGSLSAAERQRPDAASLAQRATRND
jgi:hypothetical protein